MVEEEASIKVESTMVLFSKSGRALLEVPRLAESTFPKVRSSSEYYGPAQSITVRNFIAQCHPTEIVES